jgi:hypothetical protein
VIETMMWVFLVLYAVRVAYDGRPGARRRVLPAG